MIVNYYDSTFFTYDSTVFTYDRTVFTYKCLLTVVAFGVYIVVTCIYQHEWLS